MTTASHLAQLPGVSHPELMLPDTPQVMLAILDEDDKPFPFDPRACPQSDDCGGNGA